VTPRQRISHVPSHPPKKFTEVWCAGRRSWGSVQILPRHLSASPASSLTLLFPSDFLPSLACYRLPCTKIILLFVMAGEGQNYSDAPAPYPYRSSAEMQQILQRGLGELYVPKLLFTHFVADPRACRTFNIQVLQQPKRSRMCGIGEKRSSAFSLSSY
jgi:hypothetical protein